MYSVETHQAKVSKDSLTEGLCRLGLTMTGKKIRVPDGKVCLSGRDRKGKSSQSKLNSGDRFIGRMRGDFTEERRRNPTADMKPSDVSIFSQQVDSEIPSDGHPFVSEVNLKIF